MEIIQSDKMMTVISRALNLIDGRLVDHGIRVMLVLNDMLEMEGCRDVTLRKNLDILTLLHDVGAYRTEEINNLVKFETGNVWEHSVYGYLFLREFTPLGEWSKVILYHHADYGSVLKEPEEIVHYAQMLHIADRAVVWHDEVKRSKQELKEHFDKKSGSSFSPEALTLFWQADKQLDTMAKLDTQLKLESVMDCNAIEAEEAKSYLETVVHMVDFRSHVTVTHTMSVMEIGVRLAQKMGLSFEAQKQIYYGALLHDLGKIGIPLSILEKPGRLNEEEMAIMRKHVILTGQIIEGCVEEAVAHIALRHHEKLDGSGYPLGLSEAELALPERILAVADITSALCMSRSYKEAFPKERCLSILREMCIQGQVDKNIVDTMETFFDEIITQTDKACIPLQKAYERIGTQYQSILKEYSIR